MIDLAPRNPYGLPLRSPVIVAPGCAVASRDLDPALIGALATRTAVLQVTHEEASVTHVHQPLTQARWGVAPASVVFRHLPAVRFRSLAQAEARRWARSPVPIILSVRGSAAELAPIAAQLESCEGIAGVLIDAPESGDGRAKAIAAVRDHSALPILVLLESAAEADALVAAGADALVACAYPRGTGLSQDGPVDGVVVGPATLPRTLATLRQLRLSVDAPLVALGGVADESLAHACLAAGATAVMIDGALYGDPAAPRRIAAGLKRSAANAGASA